MKWNSTATTKLRVAYAKLPPFVEVTETENGDILKGFMPDILKTVANWMNLELTFIREPNDDYGAWENNNFTGLSGMLARNEVDIILNPLLPEEEFLDFMFFSNPVTVEAFTILSGKKQQKAGLFFYFSALNNSVWLSILVSLLLTAVTSAAIFRSVVNPYPFQWMHVTLEYCWYFLCFMLKQIPSDHLELKKHKKPLSRLLLLIITLWVVGVAFLVMDSFQGLFVSKLTFKKSTPFINTLTDIVKNKAISCVSPDEIGLRNIMEESCLPVALKASEMIHYDILSDEIFEVDFLQAVEFGESCILHGRLIIENGLSNFFLNRGKCNMHISPHDLFPFSLLMGVHRNMSLSFFERFNEGITRMVDADVTGRWFKTALETSKLCTSYNNNFPEPLGIEHIYGILLLWLAGLAVSLFTLIVEINMGRSSRQSGSNTEEKQRERLGLTRDTKRRHYKKFSFAHKARSSY